VTTLRSISITTLLKIMEKQNRRGASRETMTGPRAGVLHGD